MAFVQVGNTYLNLDRVERVAVRRDADGTVTAAEVWFAGRDDSARYEGAEAQALLVALGGAREEPGRRGAGEPDTFTWRDDLQQP